MFKYLPFLLATYVSASGCCECIPREQGRPRLAAHPQATAPLRSAGVAPPVQYGNSSPHSTASGASPPSPELARGQQLVARPPARIPPDSHVECQVQGPNPLRATNTRPPYTPQGAGVSMDDIPLVPQPMPPPVKTNAQKLPHIPGTGSEGIAYTNNPRLHIDTHRFDALLQQFASLVQCLNTGTNRVIIVLCGVVWTIDRFVGIVSHILSWKSALSGGSNSSR